MNMIHYYYCLIKKEKLLPILKYYTETNYLLVSSSHNIITTSTYIEVFIISHFQLITIILTSTYIEVRIIRTTFSVD